MFGKNRTEVGADYEMFAMYDSKVDAYDMPMFALNEHDIIRSIMNTFANPQQADNKYLVNAEDYSLFRVGSYTKKSGLVQGQNPQHIANMHELRATVRVRNSEESARLGIVGT